MGGSFCTWLCVLRFDKSIQKIKGEQNQESVVCPGLVDLGFEAERPLDGRVDQHQSQQAGEPQPGQKAEQAQTGQEGEVDELHRGGGQGLGQEARRHPQGRTMRWPTT